MADHSSNHFYLPPAVPPLASTVRLHEAGAQAVLYLSRDYASALLQELRLAPRSEAIVRLGRTLAEIMRSLGPG